MGGFQQSVHGVYEVHADMTLRRQRGRVVRAPDLKSGGPGFKSRSDR